MPTFNERSTVVEAVEQVLAVDLPVDELELLLVDDASTDGTRTVLLERSWPSQVKILLHERNRGKGAAVRTGLNHAGGTWSVIMDADLEYDSADLRKVLLPLIKREAEAVFGTRAFNAHSAYGFWYVIGGKAVTFAANMLYDAWLSDIHACQKAMRTELFRSLGLRESGFGIDSEITAKLLLRGVRIFEVPVVYRARSREAGKKLTAMDGLRHLRALLRCRWQRARH